LTSPVKIKPISYSKGLVIAGDSRDKGNNSIVVKNEGKQDYSSVVKIR